MINKLPNKRIVGAKQTLKAIQGGTAKTVYLAQNADTRVTKPIVEVCNQKGVELIFIPTMDELGKMCDIDVGAATACVTN